jgi:hypothetical protein
MDQHDLIATIVPDHAQHFRIVVTVLEHIQSMRLAVAIFDEQARVVLIGIKTRTGENAFCLGDNCEQWLAESRKWRERAEQEIESYFRLRYIVAETTVH